MHVKIAKMISGITASAGLIGSNISHSLSPFIHNFLASKLKIDTVYTAHNVCSSHLKSAIFGAQALGFYGLNITTPHKIAVMDFVDKLDETAQNVQSVNLVKFNNEQLIGFNTDVYGILQSLNRSGITNINKATIYGAGGASRSAIQALKQLGCKEFTIINRTRKNAESLINYIEKTNSATATLSDKPINGDIFIQTSSALPGELMHIIPDNYSFVLDLNYHKHNQWLEHLHSLKINSSDGLIMLVFQAIRAFEILWDAAVTQDVSNDLIKKVLSI